MKNDNQSPLLTDEQVRELMGKTPREMNHDELCELLNKHGDHFGNGRFPISRYLVDEDSGFTFSRKNGEPCSESDLITDEYPRAELNPDCEMVLDMDGCLYDFDIKDLERTLGHCFDFGFFITEGDVACADGMKWEVQFEVKARYVQVPIEEEVTV